MKWLLTILFYMVDLAVILRFYQKMLGEYKSKKRCIIITAVCFLLFFSSFIQSELDYLNLVHLSAWSVLFLLFFEGFVKTKILVVILQIALAGICQAIPYFFISKYGQASSIKMAAVGHILFLFVMELGSRMYKVHRENIKGKMWVVLLCIPMLSFLSIPGILLLALNSTLSIQKLNIYLFPIWICFLFINFAAFWLFDQLSLLIETSEQNIRLEEQLTCKTDFYKSVEESQNEIRSIKHDMKNNLETIQHMLIQEKVKEAKNYICEITSTIEKTEQIVYTKNEPVDLILNLKINAAHKHDVKFNYEINIPADLPISYKQVTAILGNLLDNAIEAQLNLEKRERVVDFVMKYYNQSLMICIKNLYREENGKDKVRLTKNNDKKLHGIGLLNVKKMVDEMNGIMELSSEKHIFQVDILLYF